MDTKSPAKTRFSERSKNTFIRYFIAINVIVIVGIYYLSEVKPFPYEGYEKDLNRLQRFDAQLNEALVTTQFGIQKSYEPIWDAIERFEAVLQDFRIRLEEHPNETISVNLDKLDEAIQKKKQLTQRFTEINPILINAVQQFSIVLGEIIYNESNILLVEGCSIKDYRPLLLDNANNLFRGILTYINFRSEEQHEMLVNLVKEIQKTPQNKKFQNIDTALAYADKILELQPQLTTINKDFFQVPIVPTLNSLNNTYSAVFHRYLDVGDAYRIVLYILVFILLVVLRRAFTRLERFVTTLHIEVGRKIKAEKELEESNRQLEQRVEDRTKELVVKNNDLNQALSNLKEAQDQLVMQEKMASVGMLTTGIAHEIKNPLNFVNNFSDIAVELLSELDEALEESKGSLSQNVISEIDNIIRDLKINSKKIKEHGERADNIVKNMLLHSQDAAIQKELADIRPLMDDSLQIALESFRSTYGQFDITLEKYFDANLQKILVAPQTLSRVFVYLIDNALYTLKEKQEKSIPDYHPTLNVTIDQQDNYVLIKVKDNGMGIPKKFLDKIFEPFFTTKPTGKGNTGLGLSICYDTVVKQHKGELKVTSEEGSFTEFTITLPTTPKP